MSNWAETPLTRYDNRASKTQPGSQRTHDDAPRRSSVDRAARPSPVDGHRGNARTSRQEWLVTGLETLLIGIDSACERVVEPLFERGELPNLASLIERGVDGPLESQVPPWTASAWPSIYTGVNPGKHGVYGFLSYDGYDWDVVDATDIGERTLWELLDQRGLRSVVVNAPVTSPPSEIDGAIIPGYTAPEDPTCHPRGLLEDVREAIGEYRVYDDAAGVENAEKYERLVRMRGEAFRYCCDRFDPDFGFVQFQATDTVFHETGGDPERVRATYRAVDEEIGRTLAACDPATTIVVSDHGMGEYRGHEFRVNEFLLENGYVKTTRGTRGMPAWLPILNDRLREGEAAERGGDGTLERSIALASKVGLTPGRIGAALRRAGLQEVVREIIPASARRSGRREVDFPASTAYMRSRIECGVRINLEGRDPEGVVPPDEYDAVRDDLIELFESVTTPGGRPVFEDVAPRSEYFDGPYEDDAVDVVLVPNEFDEFLSADLKGEQFGDPTEPWNHKRMGLVVLAGEAAAEPTRLDGAHIYDVAPTVLASMGVPVSDRMDGRVLTGAGTVEEYAYDRADEQRSGRVGGTADEAVEARLATLGYIEGSE